MFHNIPLEIIDERESESAITFFPDSLPTDLYDVLQRFTRIPHSDKILPFVVAYELSPIVNLKSYPILFCHGPSGSGKSTLGEILQKFNPKGPGDYSYLQSSDTAKGWEQNIPYFRKDHHGNPKPFPLVFIDDLEPRCFGGDNGALKLALLKQIVNANGAIRRGGQDGEPLVIEVYCKLVTGSIHDLPFMEGLQELERRCLVVRHKNIAEWEDTEHNQFTLDNQIENHNDFFFDLSYDETRTIWFNSNAKTIAKHRKEVKAYCKIHDTIPRNRIQFVYPIIALAITCGFFDSAEIACETFRDVFLTRTKVNGETALQAMIRQWVKGPESPYKGRFKLFDELDGRKGFDIPYSEISNFLKAKISNMELSRSECQRPDIIAALGLLGFQVANVGNETVFRLKGKNDD